jgi:hypothetical protein
MAGFAIKDKAESRNSFLFFDFALNDNLFGFALNGIF